MVCRDQVLLADFTKKGVNGAYTLVDIIVFSAAKIATFFTSMTLIDLYHLLTLHHVSRNCLQSLTIKSLRIEIDVLLVRLQLLE